MKCWCTSQIRINANSPKIDLGEEVGFLLGEIYKNKE